MALRTSGSTTIQSTTILGADAGERISGERFVFLETAADGGSNWRLRGGSRGRR